MMTPGAHYMHLRVAITHHPLHMASQPMVVSHPVNLQLPTPLVQMLRCTQANQGVILQAHTQGSLILPGLQ